MRKVEGTATISIEELDRLREREQWYNDLRGKLKNIVGKLDTATGRGTGDNVLHLRTGG